MIYLECTGKKEYNLLCEYYKKLIEDINMVTTKEKRKSILLMLVLLLILSMVACGSNDEPSDGKTETIYDENGDPIIEEY